MTCSRLSRSLAGTIFALLTVWSCFGQALAQQIDPVVAARVDRLAQDVTRAESVRRVKRLQETYAQYSQFGLWNEMASLFANDAVLVRGDDTIRGRAAIGEFFLESFGGGRHGLPPGGLHTQLVLRPLMDVAADGRSAKGRWWEWSMTGRFGADANWAGGIYENEYVREDGTWKIAREHYHPMLAGSYEDGWRNVDADQKVVPYHFTSDETGVPVPALPVDTPVLDSTSDPALRLADLERRIAVMNDEDQIRNLQNSYGYYVDRKMWSDVTDLFSADSVLEIADVGIYDGPNGVRRALERMGPEGLQYGQLNDHLQLDMIVAVDAERLEARSRGIEFGMLGETENDSAFFTLAVFENRYVKRDGVWRIREMRLFPVMKTDYYQGWHKSAVVDPPPADAHAPDRPVPVADRMTPGAVPEFFAPNPVTGRPVRLPEDSPVVGVERLLPAPRSVGAAEPAGSLDDRLAAAQQQLLVSKAWDGAENVSAAYGEYLDDLDFGPLAAIFAEQGNKEIPFTGFYVGRDSIAARDAGRTAGSGEPRPRTFLSIHLRTQPVIHVAADGRSAAIRTRLFQPGSARERAVGFSSGMYNDQAVLEDGIWRLWSVAIDEPYIMSRSYHDGWSGMKEPDPRWLLPTVVAGTGDYPPDIPLTELGERQVGFRGGPGQTRAWPQILPMWFHYKNPVSGREPEHYWPDCVPCVKFPETSMKSHGYLLPPN
ncbi:MAG TPA: nuclear transport factor 2 family protein [Gammaproteobacteria bacterium]|nr:nuclear transport factor 2 family protein [Gammaproteobacteria bacterium]